ncbi:MAG: hypothetical protein H7A08_04190 [Oceanospirillaceae bacterium]|nr:hypothetical protein [Oceanospirillaceae bacterium]MCP5349549.1 hypothetical protein [Oceanospirillaceae bacterium]
MIIIIIYIVSDMRHHNQVEAILQEWELLTLQGNQHFYHQAWRDAYISYLRSLEIAERGLNFSRNKQGWRALRFFVLASQNVAHVCEKMGRVKDAQHYLCHAHYVLLGLIDFSKTRDQMFESASMEVNATLAALHEFLSRCSKHKLLNSIQHETKQILQQCEGRDEYASHYFCA